LKVLGLVASYRKMGNTEVLVRLALRAAEREGVQTDLIRLTDLEIRPCKGCMACLFKGERCAIDDDMPKLIDAITGCDGLIIGAPTYILGPPGIVKMALDRLIELMHPDRLKALWAKKRASGVLAVATEPDTWAPFTLPMLKLFCYTCAAPPVDWEIVAASGPGEVALDKRAVEAAERVGLNVVKALRGEEVRRPEGICPVCGGKLLELTGSSEASCPLCGIKGHLEFVDGHVKVSFKPEEVEKARWHFENALKHVLEVILPTGEKYRRLLPEIKKAMKELLGEGTRDA